MTSGLHERARFARNNSFRDDVVNHHHRRRLLGLGELVACWWPPPRLACSGDRRTPVPRGRRGRRALVGARVPLHRRHTRLLFSLLRMPA